ncbi:MAG TPA: DUF2171 domain-containing protein [Sphingomicrobium sp.]|nr:DUF2171 domain-containing protein [Sphingomicrobium sp.]
MAYDRYDTRDAPRDERSRWSGDSSRDRGRGDDRGFWDRASDEVASWFGDDDAERRRRQDQMREDREHGHSGSSSSRHSDEHSAFGRGWGEDDRSRNRDYDRGYGRDWNRDRSSPSQSDNEFRDRGWERGQGRGYSAGDRDYNPSWQRDRSNDRNRDQDRNRGYRPMAGDYGRGSDHESEQFFAASGYGRGEPRLGEDRRDRDFERSQSPYGRDQIRRTSFAGSSDRSGGRDREYDPDYRSWRDRHMSELDRDYDDYRRENQSRFGSDFGSWRERRQHKRGLLGQIHEHMEVVGNDDKHVGTVDKVAGDRLILTKSDKDAGGHHHSISCSEIERVEGDKVVLDCSADQAHDRWRDESRDRGLHERDDQGEMGPRNLNRSFEGTYR